MTEQTIATRQQLNNALVLQAAVAFADEGGLRGSACGRSPEARVVPMALYKHVANKDELLDGMVDVVFSEIQLPRETSLGRRHEAARDFDTRGAEAAPLGHRNDGVEASRTGEPAQPQRGDGMPAPAASHSRWLSTPIRFRRLHLRLRPAGTRHGFETADSAGEAATSRPGDQTLRATHTSPRSSPGSPSPIRQRHRVRLGLDLILAGLEELRRPGSAPQLTPAPGGIKHPGSLAAISCGRLAQAKDSPSRCPPG